MKNWIIKYMSPPGLLRQSLIIRLMSLWVYRNKHCVAPFFDLCDLSDLRAYCPVPLKNPEYWDHGSADWFPVAPCFHRERCLDQCSKESYQLYNNHTHSLPLLSRSMDIGHVCNQFNRFHFCFTIISLMCGAPQNPGYTCSPRYLAIFTIMILRFCYTESLPT